MGTVTLIQTGEYVLPAHFGETIACDGCGALKHVLLKHRDDDGTILQLCGACALLVIRGKPLSAEYDT